MSTPMPRVAIWLVPEPAVRRRLEAMIERYAGRFRVPPFLPHLTLFAGRSAAGRAAAAAARVVGMAAPVLTVSGKRTTARLTQTLVMTFAPDEALSRMQEELGDRIDPTSTYRFDPHLSLLYQKLRNAEREVLLGELELPVAQVRFDELRVVAIPERMAAPTDVLAWEPLLISRLG